MAGLVPAGQLRELEPDERVAAELEILGFDISRHVLGFYADLLAGLGVVRSTELDDQENGETVLVAGVKVATQTPAVRSGQRIIFASLDDAAGLVDLAFFESVQDRCAARLFGSWLLLVRGRVRRAGAGPMAVTVNATECWDIPALEEIRLASGLAAVRGAMATGDVGPGASPSARRRRRCRRLARRPSRTRTGRACPSPTRTTRPAAGRPRHGRWSSPTDSRCPRTRRPVHPAAAPRTRRAPSGTPAPAAQAPQPRPIRPPPRRSTHPAVRRLPSAIPPPACPPACLPACPPARLPACPPASPARLPACLAIFVSLIAPKSRQIGHEKG